MATATSPAAGLPVFIGGAGRSGTTLLVDMLGLHPAISPIYETSFLIVLMRLLMPGTAPSQDVLDRVVAEMEQWTRPLPMRPHFKREYEKFFHGPHYVLFERPFAMERTHQLVAELGNNRSPEEALRRFASDLFGEHARRDGTGKSRVANKTPDYVLYLPQLRALFPDMRFIHCVRDGRDVAASVMSRPWGPRSVAEAAAWWTQRVGAGLEFASGHPDQCICVRYEDLLRSPAAELRRLLHWLGEDDQADHILSRYEHGPVTLAGDGTRRSAGLSPGDRRQFTSLAQEGLAALGYVEAR